MPSAVMDVAPHVFCQIVAHRWLCGRRNRLCLDNSSCLRAENINFSAQCLESGILYRARGGWGRLRKHHSGAFGLTQMTLYWCHTRTHTAPDCTSHVAHIRRQTVPLTSHTYGARLYLSRAAA
jgi:hypothetical protein